MASCTVNTLPSAPSERRQLGEEACSTSAPPPSQPTPVASRYSLPPVVAAAPANSRIQSGISSIFAETDATLSAMKARAFQRSAQHRQNTRSSSQVPSKGAAVGSSTARSSRSSSHCGVSPQSAASSEAMQARIALHVATLEDATASLKLAFGSKGRTDEPCFKAVCRNLVVGRASSTSCSPVAMFQDRLEYKFRHQQHGCIEMLMWFRDIEALQLDAGSRTLSFHVKRQLRHFGNEYDASNQGDRLSLQFCSEEDAARFSEQCALLRIGDTNGNSYKPTWS